MELKEFEKNIVRNLRNPRIGKEIKTSSEILSVLNNEELLALFNKMDSYIEEEGEYRRSLGSYDEMYLIELNFVKAKLNLEYEKRIGKVGVLTSKSDLTNGTVQLIPYVKEYGMTN